MGGLRTPIQECTAHIVSSQQVGPRLFELTLSVPVLTQLIKPGQFVHLLIPSLGQHILRRPFSVYTCDANTGTVELLYQVVGIGTQHLADLPIGTQLAIMGPIGSSWKLPTTDEGVLLVGGGVGSAPLYLLCEQLCNLGKRVEVVLGAQTASMLVSRVRYERLLGHNPLCATDDGSYGYKGSCVSLVEELLATKAYKHVAVCGPEALMHIIATMCVRDGVSCQVSLERRMACGIGACLSCVVDTTSGKKRACVDGPVFDAQEVVWS